MSFRPKWPSHISDNAPWLIGVCLTAVGFVLTEGWLIAMARLLGPLRATLVVTSVLTLGSWIIIYCSARQSRVPYVTAWIARAGARVSSRTATGSIAGVIAVLLATAVSVGPFFASLLTLMLGCPPRKTYWIAPVYSLVSAGFWCSLYGAAIHGIEWFGGR